MNDYRSLRKKNNGSLLAVAVLALCVILSGSMLFSRLTAYSQVGQRQIIPLTRSNGITSVRSFTRSEDGMLRPVISGNNHRMLAATTSPVTVHPGFQVSDENTVWVGQTEIALFRLSYEGEDGSVVVESAAGDKILAPGTGNSYTFVLKNTGNVSLDYSMTMGAWFSDGEHAIPVVVRLTDYTGSELLGSAEETVDVLRLNDVRVDNSISAGYEASYTLEWIWPFEGNDEYDTLLGNLAAEEDLTLTIAIHTTAEYGQEGGGEPPFTGDSSEIGLMVALMLASLAGILALLLLGRKKEDRNEE